MLAYLDLGLVLIGVGVGVVVRVRRKLERGYGKRRQLPSNSTISGSVTGRAAARVRRRERSVRRWSFMIDGDVYVITCGIEIGR